jgi:hypothetical protein
MKVEARAALKNSSLLAQLDFPPKGSRNEPTNLCQSRIRRQETQNPATICDVTGLSRLFKLAGDFEHALKQELVANTRVSSCKRRHWGYLQALEELPTGESFVDAHAVPYLSSQQLLDLDIIKTATDFEAGKYG